MIPYVPQQNLSWNTSPLFFLIFLENGSLSSIFFRFFPKTRSIIIIINIASNIAVLKDFSFLSGKGRLTKHLFNNERDRER